MTRFLSAHPLPFPRRKLSLLGALVLLIAGLHPTTLADELDLNLWAAPGPEHAVPATGLIAYVEFDGLAVHAKAWKATAAHAIFEKTPAGAMIREITRQVVERVLATLPGKRPSAADIVALQEHVLNEGFAAGFYDASDPLTDCVVVLNGFSRNAAEEQCVRALTAGRDFEEEKRERTSHYRGREYYRMDVIDKALTKRVAAWFEGERLIVVVGRKDRVLDVIDTIRSPHTSVAAHPGRLSAKAEGTDLKGFEPTCLFFVEPDAVQQSLAFLWNSVDAVDRLGLRKVPNAKTEDGIVAAPEAKGRDELPKEFMPPTRADQNPKRDAAVDQAVSTATIKPPTTNPAKDLTKVLGLKRAPRVLGRWGFQGKALLMDVLIESPAPREGIARLLDQPGIRKDSLPRMPKGTRTFAAGSLDAVRAYETLLPRIVQLSGLADDGETEQELLSMLVEGELIAFTGQRIREDLLGHLGTTWCLYVPPVRERDKVGMGLPTMLFEVKDSEELGKVLDSLAKRFAMFIRIIKNEMIKEGVPAELMDGLSIKRLDAPDRGFTIMLPDGEVPEWAGSNFQPTIAIGKSHLAVAPSPGQAREALTVALQPAAERDWHEEVNRTFATLPPRLIFLCANDLSGLSIAKSVAKLPTFGPLPNPLRVDKRDGKREPIQFRVKRADVLTPEAIQAHMFPSIVAAMTDDRGFRIIAREALPLACVNVDFTYTKSDLGGKALEAEFRPSLFGNFTTDVRYNLTSGSTGILFNRGTP
jgi:hypothetical protein